jgi:phenylacetate-CoA ligase
MFGEALRRYGFWFVDAVSGGAIRQYVSDMEKKLQGEINSTAADLNNLFTHATGTTEFYSHLKGCFSIKDFPIIKKSLIKEKYDQFISSDYKNKKLHKVQTSGSTGERFVLFQDMRKRKRVIAELIYFHDQVGFRLGQRYVYLRVWYRGKTKSKIVLIAENMITFDCSSLSDASLDKLYALLMKDRSIKCLAGYATALTAIAFYFNKKGYTPDMFNVEAISSGAERLEPNAKAMLKKVFGCPVVSRYSNNENGLLAQQPVDSDHFILNTAHYFFETLKLDNDEPAVYGEPARLVLTDLYNYAMPMIRYDTEDIVIMKKQSDGRSERLVLTDISGRVADTIYDTRGNKISAHYVALQFRPYDRVPEYQFVQDTMKEYTVRLEGIQGVYSDEDIIQTFKKLVGTDARIKIEHIDKIPRLSSGKLRKIICNYHPET